jgi:hypothetical protein
VSTANGTQQTEGGDSDQTGATDETSNLTQDNSDNTSSASTSQLNSQSSQSLSDFDLSPIEDLEEDYNHILHQPPQPLQLDPGESVLQKPLAKRPHRPTPKKEALVRTRNFTKKNIINSLTIPFFPLLFIDFLNKYLDT